MTNPTRDAILKPDADASHRKAVAKAIGRFLDSGFVKKKSYAAKKKQVPKLKRLL